MLSIFLYAAPVNSTAAKLQEQIDAGLEALSIYDYANAHNSLATAYANMDPEDVRWKKIAYAYALAAWHRSPPNLARIADAEQVLLLLAERFPGTDIAASALLDMGRIAEVRDTNMDVADLPRARQLYEQVRDDFPGTAMSARATLFLAQLNAQTLKTSDVLAAIEILEAELEQTTLAEWKALLAYYAGHLHTFYLQQPEAALPFFNRTRTIGYPNEGTADRQLWQFSRIALQGGNQPLAAEVLTELVERFPRSSFRWVAERELAQIAADSATPSNEPDAASTPNSPLQSDTPPIQ